MRRTFLLAAVLLTVLAVLPAAGQSFDHLLLSGNVGAGYTLIDMPTAFGWDPAFFQDWDQLHVAANVQGLFLHFGPASIGAEVGYNRLYYYYVVVPWTPSNLYYWNTISTIDLSALVELRLVGGLSVQGGVGAHIFLSGGVTPGLKAALRYSIPLNDRMAIPLSVAAQVIFGEGTPVAVGATAGFSYRIDFGG